MWNGSTRLKRDIDNHHEVTCTGRLDFHMAPLFFYSADFRQEKIWFVSFVDDVVPCQNPISNLETNRKGRGHRLEKTCIPCSVILCLEYNFLLLFVVPYCLTLCRKFKSTALAKTVQMSHTTLRYFFSVRFLFFNSPCFVFQHGPANEQQDKEGPGGVEQEEHKKSWRHIQEGRCARTWPV